MRAAVLREYGEPLEITTVEDPTPGPREAVVEIEVCGLCRSDWHAWQGHGEWADDQVPIGQILGHEPVGRIRDIGTSVDRFAPGDRVVVPFNLGDGRCANCRSGHGNVCTDGHALGFEPEVPGAFAELVAVPAADYNLVRLPEYIDPRGAAALGCRYMTAYHALVAQADLTAGEWVTIYGCGGVGQSAIQLADAIGAHVLAVDPDGDARSRAATLGAVETVDPTAEDPVAAVRSWSDGGADVSMDALGIAETCRNSVESVCERGVHVQVGLSTEAEAGEIALPTDWMTRWEVTFVGSRGMPPTRYGDLFDLIEATDVDPSALVTREIDLSEVSDRLAAMSDYRTAGVEIITTF